MTPRALVFDAYGTLFDVHDRPGCLPDGLLRSLGDLPEILR